MKKLRANHSYAGKYVFHKRVLQFPSNQNYVSDEDIVSLFMGLVNLLKKNEQIKIEKHYEHYIRVLQQENAMLTQELEHLSIIDSNSK